ASHDAEQLPGVLSEASAVDANIDGDGDAHSVSRPAQQPEVPFSIGSGNGAAAVAPAPEPALHPGPVYKPKFTAADLQEALQVVQQLDPPGVGGRDVSEWLIRYIRCLQAQVGAKQHVN